LVESPFYRKSFKNAPLSQRHVHVNYVNITFSGNLRKQQQWRPPATLWPPLLHNTKPPKDKVNIWIFMLLIPCIILHSMNQPTFNISTNKCIFFCILFSEFVGSYIE